MKRYLIIGLIVLLGIGLFVVGYFLRKSNTDDPSSGGQTPPPTATSTPGITPGKDSKLKLEGLGFGVRGFFVDDNGKITIVQPSGHITSIEGGKNTLISDVSIENIIQASFSHDGKKLLVGFGGWARPQFSVFDMEKRSWQPLVEGVVVAEWNPVNYKVVYALRKTGYTSLSVIDLGASKPTASEITRLHIEDVDLAWLGKNEVVFWNKGNSQVPSSAWKINVATKKLTHLFVNKTSFDYMADEDGGNILASFDNVNTFSFAFFSKEGEWLKELSIRSLVDKCDFDQEEELIKAPSANTKDQTTQKTVLYCAAPRNFSVINGKLMIEDYAKRKVFSSDNFFKLNVPGGSFTLVYEGGEDLDADQVLVAGKKLYFINRYDEKLYSIALE